MENQLLIQKKKSFGIYEAALASLLFIIFNFVFIKIYGFIPRNIRANQFVYYIASFLVEFMFALTAIVVAWARHISLFEAAGMKKKINGKLIGIGFLIALVAIFGFGRLTSAFLEFLEILGYSSVLSNVSINSFWQYIIYVIVSCLAPAIFEEMLFRGVIASGLKERGFKVALFVSALIFMLMHGNAEQTVHQFIVGLIVGYIFIKTGNLWLGVIIHFFNNFISITELYIYGLLTKNIEVVEAEQVATTSTVSPFIQLLIDIIFAVVFAYVAFVIIRILIRKYLEENEKLNGKTENGNENETVITVDGTEQLAQMSVDGEVLDENKNSSESSADDEVLTQNGQNQNSDDKLKGLSVGTIVLFTLSFAYLAFDWIGSLLIGLGLV
jgi:hypothetical protein